MVVADKLNLIRCVAKAIEFTGTEAAWEKVMYLLACIVADTVLIPTKIWETLVVLVGIK